MSSSTEAPQPLWSRPRGPLSGSIGVPGDKSISHRALMFGALALGETTVEGLLEGEDVLRTAQAMRQLGATVERLGEGQWRLHGRGVGGLCEPEDVLDMGNSGTGARLLMGLLATHPFTSVLTGDASLRKRPMARVTVPLSHFGAVFTGRSGGRLPLAVTGTASPVPQTYELPVASAQVKSAVLLAGLNTPGITTVIEPEATRDHSELMLRAFGAELTVSEREDGARVITLVGQPELTGRAVKVPGDPSSAAFPVVAALIVPGSHIVVRNVGMNPLRTGLFTTLLEMGADIQLINQREEAGEPVADLEVRYSALKGVTVPPERAPSMIDEYPILSVAAACASGETRMLGLAELRVKESDRLAAMADGLKACGADTEVVGDDTLVVRGTGQPPRGGAMIPVNLDHRIGMSYLVLGMTTAEPVGIDDAAAIGTSFPGFADLMIGLGAEIYARPLVVAIDGPAAAGKGTLARRLASELGLAYLDTGSIYRAVGVSVLRAGQDPANPEAAAVAAEALTPDTLSALQQDPLLRSEDGGKAASLVAAQPAVRKALLDFQRAFAVTPPGGAKGAVLDGRDIGTVVCPDASVKLFVTASVEERARRRVKELRERGETVIESVVLQDMKDRDERDQARSVAPLRPADDALVLDTSALDADAAFAAVLAHVQERG